MLQYPDVMVLSAGKKANKIGLSCRASSQEIGTTQATVEPSSSSTLLLHGGESWTQTWPPVLGVLQCASCSFRVNGLKPLHCCSECAASGGISHSELCLQLPLPALRIAAHKVPAPGKAAAQQATAAPRSYGVESEFEQRLHRLLADGPVKMGCLPSKWDRKYGYGSWVCDRPVKSASKSCGPPYAHGTEVVDGSVHLVEHLPALDEEGLAFAELDMQRRSSLPGDIAVLVSTEYLDATRGKKVSVSLARAHSFCRCQIKLWIDSRCVPAEIPPDLQVSGFGQTWEDALLLARLGVLKRIGRWTEPSEACFQRLVRLRNRLDEVHDLMEDVATCGGDQGCLREWIDTFRELCLSLVDGLVDLLVAPPRCMALCWDVLRRSWMHILNLQDSAALSKVIVAIGACPSQLTLSEWANLGEETCWSLHFNALAAVGKLPVQEAATSAAAVYIRHHLYSLLLEERVHLQQEMERVTSEGCHEKIRVEMTWKVKGGKWHCCFKPEDLGGLRGVLMLSLAGDLRGVFCEIIEEGQAVLRGSCGISSLLAILSSPMLYVQSLAGYLVVHARQRDALLSLMDQEDDDTCDGPFDTALRCLLLGSWGRNFNDEPQALLDARLLASSPPGPLPELADHLEVLDEICFADFSPAQTAAVANALSRRLSLVRGPPGTGKTHVAAGIVAAVVSRMAADASPGSEKKRVLAATQSNVAASNLHRRLETFRVRAARVGTTLKPHEVLDQLLVQELKGSQDLEDLAILQNAADAILPLSGMDAQRVTTAKFSIMQRMAEIADAVVCTCASSGHRGLIRGMGSFPMLVIDEAAQFVEPGPWVPLGLCSASLVAVGDERQLPATLLDDEAAHRGLGISMFERCVLDQVVVHGGGFVQLDIQHRMHPSIAEFPAKQFYDQDGGGIQNAPEVHLTEPVPGFPWPSSRSRVCFVDCGVRYLVSEDVGSSGSRANRLEAEVLIGTLKRILEEGTPPSEIAVIAGYSAQQALLKRLVMEQRLPAEGLKIDTIDGFQGAERELVLASTVRSNSSREVGFLRDRRRVNVLLTRARRGLVVFGDLQTLDTERVTWQPWCSWAKRNAIVLHAKELVEYLVRGVSPVVAADASAELDADTGWQTFAEPETGKRWRLHEASGTAEWIDT